MGDDKNWTHKVSRTSTTLLSGLRWQFNSGARYLCQVLAGTSQTWSCPLLPLSHLSLTLDLPFPYTRARLPSRTASTKTLLLSLFSRRPCDAHRAELFVCTLGHNCCIGPLGRCACPATVGFPNPSVWILLASVVLLYFATCHLCHSERASLVHSCITLHSLSRPSLSTASL